tara:strand:+ start:677 stop:1162 length:486 start_codon:yes stop_codon:yes gene_type:complete
MITKINLLFISFFNVGKIKFAPGTFASLITCVIFFLFINFINFQIFFILTLIIFFYSLYAINNTYKYFESDDPSEIVIDEVIGQMIPLLSIPIFETLYPTSLIIYCIFSFFIFRLFDIWKPFPINYIDKNVKGSIGIMFDDILAGLYTTILLLVIFFFLGG